MVQKKRGKEELKKGYRNHNQETCSAIFVLITKVIKLREEAEDQVKEREKERKMGPIKEGQ